MGPWTRRTAALAAVALTLCTTVLYGPPSARAAGCEEEKREEPVPEEPWPLARLAPERVWPLSTGDGVVVAVVDSGVSEHPVLDGQVRPGFDYVADDDFGAGCDLASHGTLIAGVIAGKVTEDSPFHGIAPDARILPIRVLADHTRSTDEEDTAPIAQGIRKAVDEGADVINLSLTALRTPGLNEAVEHAARKDVVVVAAAGNTGADGEEVYPAAYDSVLAVAGITRQGAHVDSSSAGPWVDVAAPGEDIVGPAPAGGGYGTAEEGTSFAAAYASATAALVRAYYPDMKAPEVVERIKDTAIHPPADLVPVLGAGEIDPYQAVAAKAYPADSATPSAVPPPGTATDEFAGTKDTALVLLGVGAGLAAALLVGRAVVPLGNRRRWRQRDPAR